MYLIGHDFAVAAAHSSVQVLVRPQLFAVQLRCPSNVPLLEPGALVRHRSGQHESIRATAAPAGRCPTLPEVRHVEQAGQQHRLRARQRHLLPVVARSRNRHPADQRRPAEQHIQRHPRLGLRGGGAQRGQRHLVGAQRPAGRLRLVRRPRRRQFRIPHLRRTGRYQLAVSD